MFQVQSEILAFEFPIFLQKRANNMGQHEKESQRKWSKDIGWTFSPRITNILYDNLIGGKITKMNTVPVLSFNISKFSIKNEKSDITRRC